MTSCLMRVHVGGGDLMPDEWGMISCLVRVGDQGSNDWLILSYFNLLILLRCEQNSACGNTPHAGS